MVSAELGLRRSHESGDNSSLALSKGCRWGWAGVVGSLTIRPVTCRAKPKEKETLRTPKLPDVALTIERNDSAFWNSTNQTRGAQFPNS